MLNNKKQFQIFFKILLLTISLLQYGTTHGNNQASIPSVETILRSTSSWDKTPYKEYPKGPAELSVLKITLPPNTVMKWHTHPMPNAAYVVSGELIVEKKEDGKKEIFTAGQVLPEMVNTLHRGITKSTPVVLIVFYAGVNGMPLAEYPIK